jgi:hypothetical protein
MIPTTLDEALVELGKLLSQEDKDHFLNSEESFDALVGEVHHSLGRYLRNEWGLWKDSALAQHMRAAHDTPHPDDMTHVIIVAFCRQMVRTRFERIA